MNESEWEMLIEDVEQRVNFYTSEVSRCEESPWSKIAKVVLPTGLFVDRILTTADQLSNAGYSATLAIEDGSVVMYIHVKREAFIRVIREETVK